MRERVCARARVCACARARVCARVCVCVLARACVRVCVCVLVLMDCYITGADEGRSNHLVVTRKRVCTSPVHTMEWPRDGLLKLRAVRRPQPRWWRYRILGCSAVWRGRTAAESDQR